MVTWCVLPSGNEVTVAFDADDGDVWRHFQSMAYGVAALQLISTGLNSRQNAIGAAERRRHLSLPEAYYAAAVDKVLPIDGSLQDLWLQFTERSPRFPRQFAVYHHFRRLGWILQSGLNYGAHYVLYRGAAANFHSDYIVYVQDDNESLSWHTTQSLTRIAADVKKTVLLCTVDITQVSTASSTAISDWSVDYHQDIGSKTDLTTGVYRFHDTEYIVEAVAIRFWDPSTVEGQAYSFQPQPTLLKKGKRVKQKNKAKRPKHQIECELLVD